MYKHPPLARLFGVDLDKLDDLPAEKYQSFEEVSPANHLTKDDPPALLTYDRPMDATMRNGSDGIHHPPLRQGAEGEDG